LTTTLIIIFIAVVIVWAIRRAKHSQSVDSGSGDHSGDSSFSHSSDHGSSNGDGGGGDGGDGGGGGD